MGVNKNIKRYIEFELSSYQQLLREYETLRQEIILATPTFDGQPRGTDIVSRTERQVVKLMSNKRIMQVERTIQAIDKVLSQLPEEKYLVIKYKYLDEDKILSNEGVALKFNIDRVTVWRWSDAVVTMIARELGYE